MKWNVWSGITSAFVGVFTGADKAEVVKELDLRYVNGCPFCASNPATAKKESASVWAKIEEA